MFPSHLGAYVDVVAAIDPQAASAGAINGSAIDRIDYGSCVVQAANGEATGTPDSYTVDVKLQESADGSTGWADITGAAIDQIDADSGDESVDVDLRTCKKYVRAVVTVAFTGGTTPTVPVAVSIVFGGARELPVT